MPIDPRIALGYQPPQQQSPMNIMAQMQALQNARQENAMRQAQMENYASEVARRNALLPAELAAARSKAETEDLTRSNKAFEIANNRYGAFLAATGALSQKPNVTKQDVLSTADSLVASGVLDREHADAMLAHISDDPVELQSQLRQNATQRLKPDEIFSVFAPKPDKINAGGYTRVTDLNPNSPTYKRTIMDVTHTQSPDAAARLAKDTDVDLQRRLAEARKAGEAAAGKAPGVTSPDAARAFLASAGFDPKTGEDDVSKLIPKSTGGMLNTAGAKIAEAFNVTTSGQAALGKLASRSSKLVLDLLGGKLGAGVSNADREFMLQAVGDIGNSMLSTGKRLAAWKDLRGRMERLAEASQSGAPAPAADHSKKTDAEILAELGVKP